VLAGNAGDTKTSESMIDALHREEVPALWGGATGQLLDCGGQPLTYWTHEALGRARFLYAWAALAAPAIAGRGVDSVPSFWLGAFSNPTDFLTSILRQRVRSGGGSSGPPPDLEDLRFHVDDACASAPMEPWNELKERPENAQSNVQGVLIHGLSALGAGWCNSLSTYGDGALSDVPASRCITGEAIPWLPLLWLFPLTRIEIEARLEISTEVRSHKFFYPCPVYRRKHRGQTPLVTLDLPSREDPALWEMRGVALLLSIM